MVGLSLPSMKWTIVLSSLHSSFHQLPFFFFFFFFVLITITNNGWCPFFIFGVHLSTRKQTLACTCTNHLSLFLPWSLLFFFFVSLCDVYSRLRRLNFVCLFFFFFFFKYKFLCTTLSFFFFPVVFFFTCCKCV